MSREKVIEQKCRKVWLSLNRGDVYCQNGEYVASCYVPSSNAYTLWGGSTTKKEAEEKLYKHNVINFINQYCKEYDIDYEIDFPVCEIVEINNLKHYDFLVYIISKLVLE